MIEMKIDNRIFVFLILVLFCSCKKFTVEENKNKPNFQSDSIATSTVTGIYTLMSQRYDFNQPRFAAAITIYSGLYADELNDADNKGGEFEINKLSKRNFAVQNLWADSYKILAQVNSCVEGLNESKVISPSLKNQLLGETKFCRAFIYFYLLNIWGDVPLVLSTDWNTTRYLKRAGEAVVYQQILTDLKEAELLLSETYPTAEKARANKYAAEALMARVYLYLQDWKNADLYSSLVINSGKYTPLPALSDVFLKNNREAIWQLEAIDFGFVSEAQHFLSSGAVKYGALPPYPLTSSFMNSMEPNDQRNLNWIKTISYANKTYYCPYKYKDASNIRNTNIREYLNVLRVAEQYLIRAEARAHLDDIAGAVSDLNVIRKRARGNASNGPDDLPVNLSQVACLAAVEKERRIELFCEWGHRWFDLKRTNRASAVISVLKPTWTNNAIVYPIPASEIELNPNLTQNVGY